MWYPTGCSMMVILMAFYGWNALIQWVVVA